MANKVTFGLEQVHIAFYDSASPTPPAWKAPVALPGAVRLTVTPQGEESTFYADNGPYFVVTSNNGYTAELEVALAPDSVLAEMLGWEVDTNGMLVEIANAQPKAFALLGQINGDEKNRRFVFYNCKASRSSKEHTTKGETTTPNTDTLSLVILPIEIGGKKVVKGVMELSTTNQTVYDGWFDAVVVPAGGGV